MTKSMRMRWAGNVARLRKVEMCARFWRECQKERDQYDDLDVVEDNIKMYLREVGCGSMDWIDLARKRDQWRALVNIVLNLRAEEFLSG
jgi:hypothetical protein